MSGLRRKDTGKYHNDNPRHQRTARDCQIPFILANQKDLLRVRNGKKKLFDLKDMAKQNTDYSPAQLDYIDGIYESVWKGIATRKSDAELTGFTKQNYKPKKKIV